jgi:choloylglycine hydrolase
MSFTASSPSAPWRIVKRAAAASLVMAMLATPQSVLACTSFLIRTTDNGAVYGRTMEFAFELESRAIVIPRTYS